MLSKLQAHHQSLPEASETWTLACFGHAVGYIETDIKPDMKGQRIGYTTKANVIDGKLMTLTQEPSEIKLTMQLKRDLHVPEPFRQLVIDPLYSPAYLWGHVDPLHTSKKSANGTGYVDKVIEFIRNIILLYHIGLHTEAFYLWRLYKKKKGGVKDLLEELSTDEKDIMKILN